MSSTNNLKNVITNDYCVGCGGCAYITNTKMNINDFGEYIPNIKVLESDNKDLEKVCPFLSPELNETIIGKSLFSETNKFDETLGYFIDTFAGYIKEQDYREKGTSGGTTTWIVTELLKNNLIDGVIHVKENKRENVNDPF
jgi:coenzyme F420 hydrogenase subunit beta